MNGKIAFLYGSPIEGGGIEKNMYTYQQMYDFDILIPKSKHTKRQELKNLIEYSPVEDFVSLLDNYDIVFIPKLVDKGELKQHKTFFDSVYKTKAKTGLIIHEARYEAFNKIPLSFGYVHICDVVFTFSETAQLTKEIEKYTSKVFGKDLFSFTNPFNYYDFSNKGLNFSDREKRVVYFGRFATYKNPQLLKHLYNKNKELNYDFKFAMHGIDRSIGSKVSIIDLEEVKYHKKFNGYEGEFIDVYGHYLPSDVVKFMSRTLFGFNVYNFKKTSHNYVFRLEYSQMEIMSAGCVPIFHADLGKNATQNSIRLIDIENLAVWYEEGNEEQTLKIMQEISENEELYNKYIKAGKDFIEKHNNTKESMQNLLNKMSIVHKEREPLDKFLDNIYMGLSENFYKCFEEYVPYLSSYDFERKQLRYLDKTIKIFLNKEDIEEW